MIERGGHVTSDAVTLPLISAGVGQQQKTTGTSEHISASRIVEQIRNRSFSESAQALLGAYRYLFEIRDSQSIDGKLFQLGDLALLPTKGQAFFFSDLEGNIDGLALAMDELQMLERIKRNDPEDQVFICILGDSIDKSRTSSELMEFLLELKSDPTFSNNIVILPGNHELTMDLQLESGGDADPYKRLGLREEILSARESYRSPDLTNEYVQAVGKLCYESRFSTYRPYEQHPATPEQCAHEAQVGIWLLFNDIFQILPKMIVSPNGVCASHAGFPVTDAFARFLNDPDPSDSYAIFGELSRIADVDPNRSKCHPYNSALNDLIWSDIDPALDVEGAPLIGSNRRGCGGSPGRGVAFGHRALDRFGAVSGATLWIRGHQANPPEGEGVEFKRRGAWRYKNCVTIQSNFDPGAFVAIDLSTPKPTPDNLSFRTMPLAL